MQISVLQAKILRELIADGRQSEGEIAQKISTSTQVVKKNIFRLENYGIITGATTHVNYKLFGYKAVAHILICVEPRQSNQLVEFLQKMPEVYSAFSRGIEGNIEFITILKNLGQLSDVKDVIKKHFTVLEMKTAIWTDVKEMNDNLALIDEIRKSKTAAPSQAPAKRALTNVTIDPVDLKIADKLAVNGRIPIEVLAREIGISAEEAQKRYKKLKDNGVLKITIQINPMKLGYEAICIFFAVTSSEKSALIIEKIKRIPDVISIMKTAGDCDLQIWAMLQTLDQLLSVKEQIERISGIQKIDIEINRLDEKLAKWPSPRQYISTF